MSETLNKQHYELADVLGPASSEAEALSAIFEDKELYETYLDFPEEKQREVLDFLMGKSGLRITYDPFFKMIFDPDLYPERLESLLSSILGQPIKIQKILQREGQKLHGESSLVIMDIVVSLTDGSIMDVEIQKIGYAFPGERSCCYASDLIMRQYNRAKARAKKNKQNFSFRSMKPVYVIIFMESSPSEFQKVAPHYIHRKISTYDTNVQIAELSNIIYISLDTFQEVVQNIDTPLHAWLTFLSTWKSEDILRLVNSHPGFVELYRELANFRNQTEDIMSYFSEALLMMDRGTEEYMWEEMKKEKAKLTAEKVKLSAEIDKMTSEAEQMAFKTEQLASKTEQLASEMNRLTSEKELLTSEKELLSSENEKLSGENEKLSGENEKLSGENEKLSGENERLNSKVRDLEKELTSLQKLLSKNS